MECQANRAPALLKRCTGCDERLPLGEFYRHPAALDGHAGKCKSCTRAAVRANYSKHREQYREYERARFQEPERRAYANAQSAKYCRENPGKSRARWAVNNAIRDGRLFRRPCEVCGASAAEAHHDDYAKPLDVRWLCKKHHHEHHSRERALAPANDNRSDSPWRSPSRSSYCRTVGARP